MENNIVARARKRALVRRAQALLFKRKKNILRIHVCISMAAESESGGASSSSASAASSSSASAASSFEEEGTSESSEASLLSVLRAPTPSELARKRNVSSNPPRGAKRSKGSSSNDPKGISPFDRVKQYPDQQLIVSAGKLFCRACKEELSLKKSVIGHHTSSAKHKASVAKVIAREKSDSSIVESLQRYEDVHHPKGETLPDDAKVFRVKVVTTLLKAGIALNKIDDLRDLLEGNRRLSSSTNMRQLVPFI